VLAHEAVPSTQVRRTRKFESVKSFRTQVCVPQSETVVEVLIVRSEVDDPDRAAVSPCVDQDVPASQERWTRTKQLLLVPLPVYETFESRTSMPRISKLASLGSSLTSPNVL
jgi:hypothetical protein